MDERHKAVMHGAKKAPLLLPRQQKYSLQNLRDVTERLSELSESVKGGQLTTEVSDIVYVLKAQRLRSSCNAHAFRSFGGVQALLRLLRACREGEGREMVLLLGTLGNLCALEEETRTLVKRQTSVL